MARTPRSTPAGTTCRTPGSWPLVALVVWSFYVWSTRIANALGDDDLSTGGKAFSVGLSLTFVAFAVAGAVIVARSWARPRTPGEVTAVRAFAAWTAVVWLVRVPMILLADHAVGFKVVHAMLGVISVALAAWAWRSGERAIDGPSGSTGAGQESLRPAARG